MPPSPPTPRPPSTPRAPPCHPGRCYRANWRRRESGHRANGKRHPKDQDTRSHPLRDATRRKAMQIKARARAGRGPPWDTHLKRAFASAFALARASDIFGPPVHHSESNPPRRGNERGRDEERERRSTAPGSTPLTSRHGTHPRHGEQTRGVSTPRLVEHQGTTPGTPPEPPTPPPEPRVPRGSPRELLTPSMTRTNPTSGPPP